MRKELRGVAVKLKCGHLSRNGHILLKKKLATAQRKVEAMIFGRSRSRLKQSDTGLCCSMHNRLWWSS